MSMPAALRLTRSRTGLPGLGGFLRFLEGFLAIACGTFQVEAQRLGPRGSMSSKTLLNRIAPMQRLGTTLLIRHKAPVVQWYVGLN
jgi:hypothetical protein